MAFKSLSLTPDQINSNLLYRDIANIYDRVRDEDSDSNLKWSIGSTGMGAPSNSFSVGKDNYYYSDSCIVGKSNTGSTGCTVVGLGCDTRGATGAILIGKGCVHVPSGSTGAGSPLVCFGSNLVPASQWAYGIDFTATNNAVAREIPVVYNGVMYYVAGRIAGPSA